MKSRPIPPLRSLTAPIAGLLAGSSVLAAVPLNFTTNPADPIIAHGEVFPTPPNPEMIFNQSGVLIPHPFAAAIDGVYTRLTSRDAFNFTTGGEYPLGTNPGLNGVNFISYAAPGHGLSSVGATADDSNRVFLSGRGFSLDLNAPADYFYDTVANLEYRIYRHGQYGLFEESAPNTYQPVLAYDDVAVSIVINYFSGQIAGSLLNATPDSMSGTLPLVELLSLNSFSTDPIQAEGSTAEGRYGGWSFGTLGAELGQPISDVPEAGTGWACAGGLFGVWMWQRRRRA